MFAFASSTCGAPLVLGRDRAGEKPLYYLEQDGELMFASEIKALLAHPRVGRDPDRAPWPAIFFMDTFRRRTPRSGRSASCRRAIC